MRSRVYAVDKSNLKMAAKYKVGFYKASVGVEAS